MHFQKQTANILKALIIGDKTNLEDEIKEDFKNNGLSHILAISGMHISCIILITNKILDKISYKKRRKQALLIIILIVYGLIIGFIVSGVRAIIMAILMISSKMIYRKNNSLISITISCLIILICNPYYLVDTGFLLSFGATIGILCIFPKINIINVQNKIFKNILEGLLVTVSVSLAIFPITIYFFKRTAISFFFTGILMTPLVFIIELLGIIFIFMPSYILFTVVPIIEFIITIFIQISKIDLGGLYLKVPNILEIITYYLVLIYFINIKSKRKFFKELKKIIIILIITILIIKVYDSHRNCIIINFIDVNQGDSMLIQTEKNRNILVDGGGSETYDIGKNILIPYLLSKKIQKIDYMIISHFDSDHIRRFTYYSKRIES